ncbi:hypothetical protein [Roseovarius aquimarinus]|uniref:DUF304 domain-containing protein n=1 Tax=Roseovarius aquimarinus TaxID=1229156 RepID=A0ABW7I7N9_9RHOB
MTSLPDTFMPEGPLRHQRSIPVHHIETHGPGALRRIGLRCAAVALLIAATGLWLVPVVEGDAMMQLFKLAFSAALALLGVMLLTAPREATGPEVQISPSLRRMTIIERGERGQVRSEVTHDIDTLGEIVLRDGLFTAHCQSGAALVTVPVTDPRIEAALREMLGARAAA